MPVQVGAPLIDLEVHEEAEIPTSVDSKSEISTPAKPVGGASLQDTAHAHARTHVLASPSTRALAREHSIDISKVVGTGSRGQITNDDVLKLVRAKHILTLQGMAFSRHSDAFILLQTASP
jgi:2-oxoisovalerate dehydrogenase E2 component (dihydrolipoyl transacylase)